MAAALSGEVGLMFGPIAQGLPHVTSGKLRAALKQALSDPAVRERLEKEMMKALAEDRKRWSELAKRAGIQSPN